jgi:type VI secretion system secreted protein Hcp
MALLAYLKLKGQQQGDIKGSVTQKGREGKIAVIAAEHALSSPRDIATGLPTGKRLHKPYTITKELDAASPRLYALLAGNEAVTDWELQFWTPQIKAGTGVGTEVQHYTVRLTDARLVDIRFHMLNVRDPELMKYVECEELSFTYSKISWTWTAGGISAEDSWGDKATVKAGKSAKAAKPAKPAKSVAKS